MLIFRTNEVNFKCGKTKARVWTNRGFESMIVMLDLWCTLLLRPENALFPREGNVFLGVKEDGVQWVGATFKMPSFDGSGIERRFPLFSTMRSPFPHIN